MAASASLTKRSPTVLATSAWAPMRFFSPSISLTCAADFICNYDGAAKHKTLIGDDVFIGSNTELVAPLTINDGATIAAGATITKDVEAGALALSKREQKTIKNWRRPGKKE